MSWLPTHLILRLAVLCVVVATLPALLATPSFANGDYIAVLPLRGVINPVTAGYLIRGIEQAEQDQAAALIIELDTPGGLMDSMREISQRILVAKAFLLRWRPM
jgi:membrane-bound serine protease (ClpP class)